MMIWDLLLDALLDTLKALPFLYLAFLLMEFCEHKAGSRINHWLASSRWWGAPIGALCGLIPQCGFSVIAAMLFVQRNITLGTLVAVMIATSDEAIPILLSNPDLYSTLGFVLVGKFVTGIVVGYLVDFLLRNQQHIIRFEEMEEEDSDAYAEYDDD